MDETQLPLHTHLNLETAPIQWPELERFFARGRVIQVDSALDLVAVATALAKDDTDYFSACLDKQQIQHLSNETAKRWAQHDEHLWAVVVAPWVLVQEREA